MLTVPSHIRQRSSYLEIADYIESQVMGGVLQPNDRLPNTPELLEMFSVSRDTLQRALTRLSRRGLIKRIPRRGTFVTAGVASRTIGLVFGKDPFTSRSGFYRELMASFFREAKSQNMNIKGYLFLEESSFLSSVRELEQDIQEGKLCCLVTCYLSGLLGHWIEDHRDLPCLHPPESDIEARTAMGLTHLLERGRRRPLFLSLAARNTSASHIADRVLKEERLGAATAWKQAGMDGAPPAPVRLDDTEQAAYDYIIQSFRQSGPKPDSIFINHDLNTTGVLYALADLGLKMPDDVALIAHENRGCEHFCPIRLTRLICDPRDHVLSTYEFLRSAGMQLPLGVQQVPELVMPQLVPGAST